MLKGIIAIVVLVFLAVPALSENPVGDHAELWDQLRERSGKDSSTSGAEKDAEIKQSSQGSETPVESASE